MSSQTGERKISRRSRWRHESQEKSKEKKGIIYTFKNMLIFALLDFLNILRYLSVQSFLFY